MRSGKGLVPHRDPLNFANFNSSAWIAMLVLFFAGTVTQGCVVHAYDNPNPAYKNKTYSKTNKHRHKQLDTHYQKSHPRKVKKIPSYGNQHPSQAHQPPSHAKAYEVAKGKPFTEGEHHSSQGQDHRANKLKSYIGKKRPSSHGQEQQHGQGQQMHQGKPDKRDDPSSQHAKVDKSHQGRPGKKDMDHQGGQAKMDKGPSDHGKADKGNQGGPDKGKDHQGGQAKMDKGPQGEHGKKDMDHQGGQAKMDKGPSDHGKADKGSKGGPDKGKDHQGGQAKMDKGPQGEPKGKGKSKDKFATSSVEESSPPMKQPGNKGSSIKQETAPTPAPSIQQEVTQAQPETIRPKPQKKIQVAKVDPDSGKGRSKTSPSKMKKGKPDKAPKTTASPAPQKQVPSKASPEPVVTAAIAPSVFDASSRSIITSYYQNSNSKGAKGKGKKSRKSGKGGTASVTKNDILSQPSEPLPKGLESQLPAAPSNSKRVRYNQQVLLIEVGTNRVLDIINL